MPSLPRFALAFSIGLSCLAWTHQGVLADTPPASNSPVVARVGKRTITVAELERRLAHIPPFQLKTFGNTPEEVRKAFLERVMIREALFLQGAEERHLGDRDDVKEKVRGTLRSAMLAKLRAEVAEKNKPTDADVKAYYEKNSTKYRSPPRIAIWQIVVDTREKGAAIIDEMKKDPTPKRWNDLARERSLDKTTNMRGGNLGFVQPDGTTSEPGVRVSPEIWKAADGAKDTEILAEPVKDGDHWVVVWRRQSMKAVERPIELEAGSIRQILMHERTDAKIKETVANLRKFNLRGHYPDQLDMFDIASNGDIMPVRRPGAAPSNRRTASPAPSGAGHR